MRHRRLSLEILIILLVGCHLRAGEVRVQQSSDVCGWPGVTLANEKVKVGIVPSIGRIMSFSPEGGENLLWVNQSLAGLTFAHAAAKEPLFGWANFGGDKIWPVPQSDFAQLSSGRSWPADKVFDGGRCRLSVRGQVVILETAQNSSLGLGVRRQLTLLKALPVLKIEQILDKKTGRPSLDLIQSVTQVQRPDLVIVPIAGKTHFKTPPAANSPFPDGVSPLTFPQNEIQSFVKIADGYAFLSQPRPGFTGKFYTDSRRGWIGAVYGRNVFLQLFQYLPDGYYADGGCSVEVYVSDYFELELLSPAQMLRVGESLSFPLAWAIIQLPESANTPRELAVQCEEAAQRLSAKCWR